MIESEGKAEFITHLIEGNNAMVRGDIDAAIAAYHMAFVLNSKFAMTCSKLGQAYYKKKDYDEAIKYYKLALELDPKQTETLYRLGKAYGDSGMVLQAAVAFDMARERDKDGDLSDRIDSTERRIRRKSSHGAMRPVTPFETLKDTVTILINHPAIVAPVALSVFVFIITSFAARWALAAFNQPKPLTDFTRYLFEYKAPPLSASTVIYLFVLFVIFCIICVPLLNIETALVGRLTGGREATFDEALNRSFGQVSPLAGVTFLMLLIAGLVAILSSYVYKGFGNMIHDFFMAGRPELPQRYITVLILPTMVVVMAHFLYTYPSIILDRKKMEGALKKSITFASKHYWFTFVFLCCFIGTYFLVIHYSGDIITPKYIFAQFVLVAAQAFFVAGITITYSKTQRPRHKRSGRKKTTTPEDVDLAGAGDDDSMSQAQLDESESERFEDQEVE